MQVFVLLCTYNLFVMVSRCSAPRDSYLVRLDISMMFSGTTSTRSSLAQLMVTRAAAINSSQPQSATATFTS